MSRHQRLTAKLATETYLPANTAWGESGTVLDRWPFVIEGVVDDSELQGKCLTPDIIGGVDVNDFTISPLKVKM